MIEAPRTGGEAKAALASFDRLLALLPGCQVIVYDGELRGTHLDQLLKRHGVLPLAKLHNSHGERVLERHYGVADVALPDGSKTTTDLHLKDGAPYLKQLDEAGDVHLVQLDRVKIVKDQRGDGTWRLYLEFEIPELHGGGLIRLRADQTAEDDAKEPKFNRAENLRVIAPIDPDYAALMARRPDCESGNAQIDNTLPRERARSVGSAAQLWDLIGYSTLRNARATWIHRMRHGPPLPSAA